MNPLDCLELYADADFYDQEFAKRTHEIPFFVTQALQAKGPILEVCCGTGRLTLSIARAGGDITGLDVAQAMLERAQRKATAEKLSVSWIEGDCRQIASERKYALIFSATNAMQHLHDFASVNAFLVSVRELLLPTGTLIIDVFNPDVSKLSRPSDVRFHKVFSDTWGREIRVDERSEYHAATQVLSFTLTYSCNGQVARTKHVNMRCFYPEELLTTCRFNGLEVVQRLGDYDGTPFTDSSPKQILFCRKMHEA